MVLKDRTGRLIGFAAGKPYTGESPGSSAGFYDRMGGERLVDERGLFTGAYGWRDARWLFE